MVICQVMIQDFMYGWGGLGEYYGRLDLETGIQYAEDLMKFDGLTKEPFHGYNLKKFISWCKMQLKKLEELMLYANCSEATIRIKIDNLTEDEIQQIRNFLTLCDKHSEDSYHEGPVNENNGRIDIHSKLGETRRNEPPQELLDEIKEKWFDTSWFEDIIFGMRVIVIKGDTPFNNGEWLMDRIKELPCGSKLKWESEDG